MRVSFLLTLFFLLTLPLQSQEKVPEGNGGEAKGKEAPHTPHGPPDISGTWVGELLQNEGGIADRFEFSMEITQVGLAIKGTTYVRLEEIYAEMDFSGYVLPNGSWKILERGVVRSQKPLELSWCMKRFLLTMTYTREGMMLTGPWWGDSAFGPCIPGSVRLRKRIKRA